MRTLFFTKNLFFSFFESSVCFILSFFAWLNVQITALMRVDKRKTLLWGIKLILFILIYCNPSFSHAQSFATIGTGTTATTSTGSDPIDGYFNFFRYQVIYTAAQLTAAGMPAGAVIDQLGWSVSGDYGGGNMPNYEIRMAHTTAINSATHDASALTTVRNAAIYNPTVVAAGAFDMIAFNNTFTWNGTSNILVDINAGLMPFTAPYGQVRTIATTTANGSRYVRCDGCGSQAAVATGTINTTKPQVRFRYAVPTGCTGTPTSGTTASTSTTVCSGSSFTLSTTGSTSATGLTYQWQSSPNGTAWTDIAGATALTFTTTQTVSTYYRLNITCSGQTGSSSSLLINSVTCCNHTFNMTDSWGDGWNGANIGIRIGTTVVATAGSTFTGGTAATDIIPLQNGTAYNLLWTGGGFPTECGYTLLNSSGTTLNSFGTGAAPATGSQFYTFTAVCPTPCSGTPTAGTTVSSAVSTCPAVNFNLSLSGTSTVTGLTYQWQSSPNGTAWTNIGGATAATLTTNQTAATYYQCLVTCAGNTAASTPLQVTMGGTCQCLAYGASSATSAADEEILNVTLGTINNTSTCATLAPGVGSVTAMYSNYTGALSAPNVSGGTSVPFSVTLGTCGGWYGVGLNIYIDYNQNGSFADAGELVYSNAAAANGANTGTIAIPLTATAGTTRMRVVATEGTVPGPTGTYTWGETEDYCINVLPPPPCAGTPAPGNTVSTSNSVCAGVNFTLSNSTPPVGTGLTYQWQSSPNGTAWTNIAGATAATLTTNQTVSTYYQCLVTCAGNTGTSTPLLVTTGSCINITNGSTTTCNGIFYDSGGATGDYLINETYTYTIFPNAGNFLQVSFSSFATENNYDGLSIYNGPNTASPLISSGLGAGFNTLTCPAGSFYGTTSPGTVTSTHSTGALTFVFTSEGSINAAGWIASISCIPMPVCAGTPNPGNTLSTANPVCDGANFTLSLQNATTGSGVTYQWQSSPNGTTWTNIAGATLPTLTTSQTIATYYRCVVTCAGNNGNSNPILINGTANAGTDVTVCSGAPSVTLNGSTSVVLSGTFTVVISGAGFLDEVSWTLTNSVGTVVGSGGVYATGSTNTIPVTISSPPLSFFLETQGPWNDNIANYSIICNGATIFSGTVNGGQTTTIPGIACSLTPTYTWSPSTNLSNPNIANPVATPTSTTTYTLTTDAGGCIGTDQVTVAISNVSLLVSSQTNVSCFGGNTGNVTVVASNGATPYQYNINGGAYQPGASFFNLIAGTYTIEVKDANNCTATTTVTITEPTVLGALLCKM